MKRAVRAFFCLSLMALAVVGGPLASHAQESGEQPVPRAVLPYYRYDFGDITKGEPISFIFPIKNVGSANLKIKDVRVDCGCTVAHADDVIPPGTVGKAMVTIETNIQSGSIIKSITLRTNDPDQLSINLFVSANILSNADGSAMKGSIIRSGKHVGPIFIGPGDHASFTTVAGQKAKTEFTISAERGPVKIVRLEGDRTHLNFHLDTIEEGKKYKVVVESIPTDEPGIYDERLRIFTDSPTLESYPVGVKLRVLPKQ